MSSSKNNLIQLFVIVLTIISNTAISALNYEIVDTDQTKFYNDIEEISCPENGEAFYGQDANFTINQPSYTDNDNGTITDNVTGLMWQKTCDFNNDGLIDVNDKMSYIEALDFAGEFDLAGYNDWRLPSIKELYSLILFSGVDPSGWNGDDTESLTPFIDTEYFDFAYGDVEAGERIIDAQMASSTLYVGTTMMGDETMFGVNFADGRIKGYPTGPMPGQPEDKQYYVMYVRGNSAYGENDFLENEDNTISDLSTGLMWDKNDSESGMNWEEALAWVQQKNNENYLGYNDWRLPSVKELQSIVDYSRSPSTSNSPALNPVFECTAIIDEGGNTNYPFFWSGTTHENMMNGGYGSYVCFGEALGFMEDPFGNMNLLDVHGAGAQRSDPKNGNPDDYPYGHGPQGDVIRINNFVRLVRNNEPSTGMNDDYIDETDSNEFEKKLSNYPNPFNPETTINFQLPDLSDKDSASIEIFNSKGQKVKHFRIFANQNSIVWNGDDEAGRLLGSGLYLYRLSCSGFSITNKMVLLK